MAEHDKMPYRGIKKARLSPPRFLPEIKVFDKIVFVEQFYTCLQHLHQFCFTIIENGSGLLKTCFLIDVNSDFIFGFCVNIYCLRLRERRDSA